MVKRNGNVTGLRASQGNGLESTGMGVITEQFQVLAAGDCAAIRSILEHSSVAHRFRLDTCPLHADIMASIDRVAPDLILVDADGTRSGGSGNLPGIEGSPRRP